MSYLSAASVIYLYTGAIYYLALKEDDTIAIENVYALYFV